MYPVKSIYGLRSICPPPPATPPTPSPAIWNFPWNYPAPCTQTKKKSLQSYQKDFYLMEIDFAYLKLQISTEFIEIDFLLPMPLNKVF